MYVRNLLLYASRKHAAGIHEQITKRWCKCHDKDIISHEFLTPLKFRLVVQVSIFRYMPQPTTCDMFDQCRIMWEWIYSNAFGACRWPLMPKRPWELHGQIPVQKVSDKEILPADQNLVLSNHTNHNQPRNFHEWNVDCGICVHVECGIM